MLTRRIRTSQLPLPSWLSFFGGVFSVFLFPSFNQSTFWEYFFNSFIYFLESEKRSRASCLWVFFVFHFFGFLFFVSILFYSQFSLIFSKRKSPSDPINMRYSFEYLNARNAKVKTVHDRSSEIYLTELLPR